jgi:ABC-2 type transport system permease protein
MVRPNRIRQIASVARFELLKYLRGRRLIAILLLTALVNTIYLVVPPATASQYSKDPTEFLTDTLGFLGVLSILSATFFGADAIVSEFESKTGYFLFPNPIRKTTVFLGKFIASVLVSAGVIALYYTIAVVSVRVIDGSIPAGTGLSFAYALVYLFAILAVADLFSAVMRSSVFALTMTFFTFLLILPIFDAVAAVARFKAWFSITFASGIATNILKNPPNRQGNHDDGRWGGSRGFGWGRGGSGRTVLSDSHGEPCHIGSVFHRCIPAGCRAYATEGDVRIETKTLQNKSVEGFWQADREGVISNQIRRIGS